MKNVEEMIYKYQKLQIEKKGYNKKTVECQLRAILAFKKFIDKPLSKFNKDDVLKFKSSLQDHKKLKISTVHSIMVYLEQFYCWLCRKPGYRSIKSDDIEYFTITRAEKAMLNHSTDRPTPSLEDVLELHRSIIPDSEIRLRNRAMLAMAATAGLREAAEVTLRFGSIDDDLFICQDPEMGVQTKYSKKIWTLAFNFHPELTDSIRLWKKLLEEKGFKKDDPFFPKFSPIADTNQQALFPFINEVTKQFLGNPNIVNQIFQRLCIKAKLQYFHPHSYRHRWANLGFENCFNASQIKALSECAGHEEIATLLRSYGHFTIPELKKQLLIINDNISKKKDLSPKDFQVMYVFQRFIQLYPEVLELLIAESKSK